MAQLKASNLHSLQCHRIKCIESVFISKSFEILKSVILSDDTESEFDPTLFRNRVPLCMRLVSGKRLRHPEKEETSPAIVLKQEYGL